MRDLPATSNGERFSFLERAATLTSRWHAQILLLTSVALAAVLLIGRLDQGWWHHDDGSLAHSAERVLAGELPHRDFVDLYTGLLSFLNAGVFALFGEDMFNLRLPLFLMFLGFVGCFYAVARRIVRPLWAFVATLFAIGWSVPVYPAPMPSWYALFLTTMGAYCVVRFFETDRRRWLVLAGVCGGLSIAIKIVGIWFVIAVVLALLALPLLDSGERPFSRRPARPYGLLVIVSAVLVFAFVGVIVSGNAGPGEVVGVVLPVAALCIAVAYLGWRADPDSEAGGATAGELVAFLAGAGLPVALLVTPYAVTGSIDELVEGALIAPRSRYDFASFGMPDPIALLWALPVVAVIIGRSRVSAKWRQLIDVASASVIVFLVATAASSPSYSIIWDSARALAPFAIVVGALAIARRSEVSAGLDARVVSLLVLVAGFLLLLQFPFGAPVYFCYVAPLVMLAAIAGLKYWGLSNGLLPAVILIALAVFGMRQLDHQSLSSLGTEYIADAQVAILDDERASIRVLPETKQQYDRIRLLVARHRAGDRPIFAGPDTPEIYFLTRSRNPTPAILDFLDRSGSTRGNRLTRLLEHEGVSVVVVNHSPEQSRPLAPATVDRIRTLYGAGERVGRFEVRWTAGGSVFDH